MKNKLIKIWNCLLLSLFVTSTAIAQTLTITNPSHINPVIYDLPSIEGTVQTEGGKVIQLVEVSIKMSDKPYYVWASTTSDDKNTSAAVNPPAYGWVSVSDNPKNMWIPAGPLVKGIFEGTFIWSVTKSTIDQLPGEKDNTLPPGNYTISARYTDAKGNVSNEVQERIAVRKRK